MGWEEGFAVGIYTCMLQQVLVWKGRSQPGEPAATGAEHAARMSKMFSEWQRIAYDLL